MKTNFEDYKKKIIQKCKAKKACQPEFERVLKSQTLDELITVLCENLTWCLENDIFEELPAGITSIGGNVDLEGYNHPLPAGITSIGGYVDLRGYNHPLPAGITSIGGNVYLRRYNHPLPAGITSIGGNVYLEGYNHPLPAGKGF